MIGRFSLRTTRKLSLESLLKHDVDGATGCQHKSVVLAQEQQILPVGHHPDTKAGGKYEAMTTIIATLEAEKTPRGAVVCQGQSPLPEDLAVGGGRGRAIRVSLRGIYTNAHKWKRNSSAVLTVCGQGPGSTLILTCQGIRGGHQRSAMP